MTQEPIWKLNSQETNFPQLQKDIVVDVAIIGGGITGITTAELLQQYGMNIAVLEARKIGQGTTGHSTGNLYEVTEYGLQELKNKYDTTTLQEIIQSRRRAVAFISENVSRLNLDCDFETVPMYLFENDENINIDNEKSIAKEIGLPYADLPDNGFPLPYKKGMIFSYQAQINPLSYVQQLALQLPTVRCSVYENTHVTSIEENITTGIITLKTDQAVVHANYVVHATHTPLGLQLLYHPVLGPYREYGIAFKLHDTSFPPGIFWGNFEGEKYSIRRYDAKGESYMICVGSMHKTGQTDDNMAHIDQLKKFVNKHFDVECVTHQWGGQNYKPADLLPYIGRKETDSREFIATGFSTDGLVYGTLAAKIITAEIVGISNPYSELYKASRHNPLKAAEKFIKENVNMAGQMIKDLVSSGEELKDVNLSVGDGKIVQGKNGKVAVYKNLHGQLTILSPICPHMGCTVHWNNAEKSWDCPCHGSRFDTDGKVIEGPALTGLKLIES